jgi:hypothetical protein
MAQQNAKKAAAGQGNEATKTSEQRSPKSLPPTTPTPLIAFARLLGRQTAREFIRQQRSDNSLIEPPVEDAR